MLLVPIDIPDGTYQGYWSGHTLKFEYDEQMVYVETKIGIRGLNIPVEFEIEDSKVVEEGIKKEE